MIRSFRLRLALLSALLSGLALVAFGFSTWWLTSSVKLEQIESQLRLYAEREAAHPPDIPARSGIEMEIARSINLQSAGNLFILIQDKEGKVVYQSATWPASLDPEALPWPRPPPAKPGAGTSSWLISEAVASEPPPPRQLAQLGPHPGPGRFPPTGNNPPRSENDDPRRREEWRPPPPPRSDPPPRNAFRPERNFSPDAPPSIPDRRPRDWTPLPGNRPALPVSPADSGPAPSLPPVSAPRPPVVQEPVAAPENQPAPQPDSRPPPPPPPVSTLIERVVDKQTLHIALANSEFHRVALGINLRALDAEMQSVRTAILIALPLALFLIGLGAWAFSSRALRPLEKLTTATRRVTAEGLNQRISGTGEDREFIELINVFNSMLERLERSFQQAHRFSADAAHELKTPLAILQGQLELAINNAEAGSANQAELTNILDEVRRLSSISRKLLLLSQADAGRLALHRTPFALSETLADLVDDTRMLAPQLKVSADIQPDIVISADGTLLMQVLHNLISNAIKYNIEGGWIRISAKLWPQRVEVLVDNASAGIPKGQRGRLFERFYRAEADHNRAVDGVGLGLALSREIARAHGGDLSFRENDDQIVQFSLLLPR